MWKEKRGKTRNQRKKEHRIETGQSPNQARKNKLQGKWFMGIPNYMVSENKHTKEWRKMRDKIKRMMLIITLW